MVALGAKFLGVHKLPHPAHSCSSLSSSSPSWQPKSKLPGGTRPTSQCRPLWLLHGTTLGMPTTRHPVDALHGGTCPTILALPRLLQVLETHATPLPGTITFLDYKCQNTTASLATGHKGSGILESLVQVGLHSIIHCLLLFHHFLTGCSLQNYNLNALQMYFDFPLLYSPITVFHVKNKASGVGALIQSTSKGHHGELISFAFIITSLSKQIATTGKGC